MKLQDAIAQRYSVREFLDRSVPRETIARIITAATYAPSGGNLQPWHIYVAADGAKDQLLQKVQEKQKTSEPFDKADYPAYPDVVSEPYRQRQLDCGYGLYESLGIERADKTGRLEQTMKNFRLFNAPVGLFFFLDRGMQPYQWGDVGMLMQNIMLLAKQEGLDTCPQICWTSYNKVISQFFDIPDHFIMYSGMALGYADLKAKGAGYRTTRSALAEVATLRGFDGE